MASYTTGQAGGQVQPLTNIPAEYTADALELARAQRMAQMLSSAPMAEGQMVSGRYVAPSWTQSLAQLANAATGAYFGNQAEEKQLKLAEKLRQDKLMTQQGIMEAIDKGDTKKALAIASSRPEYSREFIAPLMANVIPKAPTPPAPTTEMQNFLFAKERGEIPKGMTFLGYQTYMKQVGKETEGGLTLPTVNNNGLPVGRFDKTGRYISPQGRVYTASAMTEAQKEHDVTMDLGFKLNNLTKNDIKNAYGSAIDYTASKVGQMVGRKDVVDAQNKINSIQIKNVLDNLSQLKGASSDKEMAQMIKDFPAYTASPDVMEKWVERAAKTANRFLKRSEQRYGFDTEYAQEGRFDQKEQTKPSALSASSKPNTPTDKTVVRTGEVQNGPNKGKKIVEYSDGTREYK
jgi:hypothetical protein